MRTDELKRCPRFDGCGAPVCPLYGAVAHLRGEPICSFMLEAVKPAGEERVRSILPPDLAESIIEFISGAMASSPEIARRLKRAAQQGSKLESGRQLKRSATAMREESIDACTSA
jgi:hypothetical protein